MSTLMRRLSALLLLVVAGLFHGDTHGPHASSAAP